MKADIDALLESLRRTGCNPVGFFKHRTNGEDFYKGYVKLPLTRSDFEAVTETGFKLVTVDVEGTKQGEAQITLLELK